MSLAERLQEIRVGAKARIPEQTRLLMEQATEELRDLQLMAMALRVGDALPPFTLPNQNKKMVSSRELLESGKLVLTFYRGVW